MKRRIALTETVIGPGAIVRIKKTATNRIADLIARWEVLSVDEQSSDAVCIDVEDAEDRRCFELNILERVKGGVEVVTGYTYVDDGEIDRSAPEEDYFDGELDEDLDGIEPEGDAGSLFDDPIALQMAEDAEDEDSEDL